MPEGRSDGSQSPAPPTGSPPDLTRVAIVGTSCSGKSSLAARLARALDCRHIELDEIHWGPGWSASPPDVFRADVEAALATPRWVCAGNYSTVRDIVWGRATALVWIDLPFTLVFTRSIHRTLRRTLTRERVCGDNRERWLGFLESDWIPYWVARTWRRNRVRFREIIDAGTHAPLDVIVLRSTADVERFASLQASSAVRAARKSASSARTERAST